jgi:hypothetical protein
MIWVLSLPLIVGVVFMLFMNVAKRVPIDELKSKALTMFNDDMPTVERLVREDFHHFNDIYLKDDSLMRFRTERLCEEIVRHVLSESKH